MYHAACVLWLLAIGISKGINAYTWNSDCGATELKVENIDAFLRKVEFSWKGQTDFTSGKLFTVKCYFTRGMFALNQPFTCTFLEMTSLKRREGRWYYEFTNTDYYCAVVTYDSLVTKISNIVHLRTPASRISVIVGAVISAVVFVFFAIAAVIVWHRRRKGRPFVFMGILTRTSASNQTTIGTVQPQPPVPPMYITPTTHLPPGHPQATHPAQIYPPQAQIYQQWGEPPPYTVHKDTSQSRAPQ